MATLTMDDLSDSIKANVYVQDYSAKSAIDGVKIIPVKNFVGEDGDFSEVLRLGQNGEIADLPDFKIAQINRSRLTPRSIKAWHIHLNQDDLWYLPPSNTLFVGLWDLRKNSPTHDTTMRITLGAGQSNLLFIPKGVAHGMKNTSKKDINLFYFVNQQFNLQDPDEKRLKWDAKGADFWETPKE